MISINRQAFTDSVLHNTVSLTLSSDVLLRLLQERKLVLSDVIPNDHESQRLLRALVIKCVASDV